MSKINLTHADLTFENHPSPQFAENAWSATAPVSLFQDWKLRFQVVYDELCEGFELDRRIDIMTPLSQPPNVEQVAILKHIILNAPVLATCCNSELKKLASKEVKRLLDLDPEEHGRLELAAKSRSIDLVESIQDLAQLTNLTIFKEHSEGIYFFRLRFYWAWSEEHHPEVLFWGEKVVYCGWECVLHDGELHKLIPC
jgi:hypothetical protein